MSNLAIKFDNITKKFHLQEDRTFKELLPHLLLGKSWSRELTVFSNLSFEIQVGETVGIIGRNGSGKSTMLKLIAGVSAPTYGKVTVDGKVAPLIEVGAGFHQELTGYENIFLSAAIMGMHKKEIELQVNNIVEFSELKDFIHIPVKKYSTGMYMRLGFSIAIYTNAPILLIDEVLAVGDISFQKKCLQYLGKLKKEGNKTIIFVSHDEKAVKGFCDRAILLNKGGIVADGDPSEIIDKYHHLLSE